MLLINYSLYKRKKLLRKIIHWKQLDNIQKELKIKSGATKYAFEFMKKNLDKYIKVKDVQNYCNQRTMEETGQCLGDPSRSFEILRNDKLPNKWDEFKISKIKYVKYNPNRINNIINNRTNHFSIDLINNKMKECNYKCELTGLSINDGNLAADHFIPKEKGGSSNSENCIIINKNLNEKKNNTMPIEWFCKSLLNNFMNICKKVGILEECRYKLIKFIQEFS